MPDDSHGLNIYKQINITESNINCTQDLENGTYKPKLMLWVLTVKTVHCSKLISEEK